MVNKLIKKVIFTPTNIYLFGEIFSKISPFLILPILSRILSVESFGVYSIFHVSTFFSYIFISLATTTYISVVFYKNKEELPDVIWSSTIVSTVIFLLSLVLMCFVKVGGFFEFWDDIIIAILVVGYLSFFFQMKLTLDQFSKKSLTYVVYNIVRSLILVLSVYLLSLFKVSDVEWYVYAYCLSYALLMPNVIIHLYKVVTSNSSKLSFNWRVVTYSLPLIPSALSNWFKTSSDRFIIISTLGAVALGYYSAAYQVAFAISIVSIALTKVLGPELFSQISSGKLGYKTLSFCNKYAGVFAVISILYLIVVYFFTEMYLGVGYIGAGRIASLLVIACSLQGLASLYVGVLYYVENTKYTFWANMISLFFHICIAIVLVLYLGDIAAFVIASILSSLLYLIVIYSKVRYVCNKAN